MPTFNGLPLHPLVVHAVVVLLPLAVLGVTALAVRPSLADRFGSLVVGVAALATVSIPVATSTGEDLEHRVGDPGTHAHLGDGEQRQGEPDEGIAEVRVHAGVADAVLQVLPGAGGDRDADRREHGDADDQGAETVHE